MRHFQLTNWSTIISSAEALNKIQLYKPGKVGQTDLYGYLVDFNIYANIPSIAEATVPASDPLATESDQAQAYYNLPNNSPHKKLDIYSSDDDGVTLRRHFGIYLFNRRPYFFVDLVSSFTKAASAMIGLDGRSKKPLSLWAKLVDDGHPNNTGALSGTDSISIWIAANEEAPRLETLRPVIFTQILAAANTEYALSLPEGCVSYAFKCRGNQGDAIADVRYSWQPGIVTGSSGFYTLDASSEESDQGLFLLGKTLYFASSTANVPVILRCWV